MHTPLTTIVPLQKGEDTPYTVKNGFFYYDRAIEKIIDTSSDDALQNNIDAFNGILERVKSTPYYNCLALFYSIYQHENHIAGTEFMYEVGSTSTAHNVPYSVIFLFSK